jgi:hypothetical protein
MQNSELPLPGGVNCHSGPKPEGLCQLGYLKRKYGLTPMRIAAMKNAGMSARRNLTILSGAAVKKIEPQFSALFGFLLLTLAFNVRRFMRQLTKAKHSLSM